jgi:hypothetical protein
MRAANTSALAKPASRLRELRLVLPEPPLPLGTYVEASQVGALKAAGISLTRKN